VAVISKLAKFSITAVCVLFMNAACSPQIDILSIEEFERQVDSESVDLVRVEGTFIYEDEHYRLNSGADSLVIALKKNGCLDQGLGEEAVIGVVPRTDYEPESGAIVGVEFVSFELSNTGGEYGLCDGLSPIEP
jgi:hypothetical protein